MISSLRAQFNQGFLPEQYASLLVLLEQRCGSKIDIRIAETPIFVPLEQIETMAAAGAELTALLLGNPA